MCGTYLSKIEVIDVLDVEVFVFEIKLICLAALSQVVVKLSQLSSHYK